MIKNYVVIGYGNWSRKIIDLNQKINENYKLNGVFYRSNPTDSFYKDNIKIFYSNWKIMINDLRPKIVIVCMPPSLNIEILNFLKKKKFIKKILIEKPTCTSSRDNQYLKNLRKDFKKKIFVNYLDIHSKSLKYLMNDNINFDNINMQISGPSSHRKDMTPLWEYSPHFLAFLILKVKNIEKYKISCEIKELKFKKYAYKVQLSNKNKYINLICGNHTQKKFRKISLENKFSKYNYNDRGNNHLSLYKSNKKSIIFKKENLLDNALLYFFNNFLENKIDKRYDYVDVSYKINNLMLSIEKFLYK